jgi:phosphohistidine phosphatase SixA
MTTERAFTGVRECLIDLMKREKFSESASIMLVGHEPDLSNLAGALIGVPGGSVHLAVQYPAFGKGWRFWLISSQKQKP